MDFPRTQPNHGNAKMKNFKEKLNLKRKNAYTCILKIIKPVTATTKSWIKIFHICKTKGITLHFRIFLFFIHQKLEKQRADHQTLYFSQSDHTSIALWLVAFNGTCMHFSSIFFFASFWGKMENVHVCFCFLFEFSWTILCFQVFIFVFFARVQK
jgi:hypothetical protein